ncbi:MAG: hypothetical protein MUQ56_09670 [Thermoleophilia bacterium]|nr:hypothetical protein [Thermoleophilia bacterium]
MDHWSIPTGRASGGDTSSGGSAPVAGSGRDRVARRSRRAGRKWAMYGVVVMVMTCALLWSALTPGLMLRLAGLLFGALFLVLTLVMGRAD